MSYLNRLPSKVKLWFFDTQYKANNPYAAGNAVGNSPNFVERADILKKVEHVLRHSQDNAIVLYGQRRIGKSSILRELEARLLKDGIYFPVFFSLQEQATRGLEDVLRDLASTIYTKLRQPSLKLGTDPQNTFRQSCLPQILNNLPATSKILVLLFDESEILIVNKDFFTYLRDDLLRIDTERLKYVFAVGHETDDLNTQTTFFETIIPQHVHLPMLSHEETFELIQCSETNKTLHWPKDVQEKVWKQTNGHPYLTQQLCSQIWDDICDPLFNGVPTVTLTNVENAILKIQK